MPSDRENSSPDPEKVGLCATCRFRRDQVTRRGSVFVRCARADEDTPENSDYTYSPDYDTGAKHDFDRYPALPVRSCQGHSRAQEFGIE
jgi:hypothetical protein